MRDAARAGEEAGVPPVRCSAPSREKIGRLKSIQNRCAQFRPHHEAMASKWSLKRQNEARLQNQLERLENAARQGQRTKEKTKREPDPKALRSSKNNLRQRQALNGAPAKSNSTSITPLPLEFIQNQLEIANTWARR